MIPMEGLREVREESFRQDKKWGEQNHSDGTGSEFMGIASEMKKGCDEATANGTLTWRHILEEEVYEAFECSDPEKLKMELLQTAAVALQWREAISRRQKLDD